jgi:phage-related protein
MGALFQGSGIEQQKSLELTEAAMQRAADMASVMGIDMQVALDSISGAAKGNFTMMDNLGVAMNDTTLKAYAASKGIVSLTEAEKAFGDLDIDLNEFGGGAYALDEMKAKYNELVASATNGTGEVRDQAQAALDSVGVSFLDLQQKGPDKLFDKFVDGAEKAAKAAGNVKLELSGAEKAELAMEMFFDKTAQYEGNFAREATQTISGSFGLLQASMDSLVAGLGNADADVGNLTRNVTDALTAVVSNVGPIISNLTSALPTMFSAIADELPTMLPMVLDAIKSLISSLTESMPMFSEVAGQIVGVIVEGLITALPALAQSAIQLLGALGTAIIDNLPLLLEAAIQIVAELAQGLSDALPTLIPTIVKMVADMVQMLIDNAPLLLESALALIEGLVTGLIDSLPILIDALPELIDGIVKFLIEALPMIIDAGVRLFTALIEALPEIIELIVPAIPQIINGITTALVACTSAIIDAGLKLFVALVESLPEIIAEIVKAVPDIIDGIVKSFDSMADDIIDIGSNLLVNIWNGMVAYQGWLQEQITGFFQGIVDTIGSIFGGSAQAIKNETPKTVAAVKERNDAMIAEAKRHQDQEDALRDAANSRHYSRIKEAQNYQNQVDAERDAANAKYYSNEKKAATETANLTKTLAASTAKSRETAAETAEKAAKAAYDAEKLLIEDYRNDVEYSIEGEIAMWEKLGESHKEVSKEKIEIEKSIAKLREDLRKEEEAAAKKLADQQNAYGDALTEALKRRARQETDAKTAELKAQQEAEKQAVNDRIDLIKDAEYREIELDTDTFKGKIKLIDEEHIARIRLTDETLAATLSAYNQEQQAIIDTIALTDQQAAKRLQDIKDQKDAILAESDAAKAAREEASHAEKMADFDHRMAIAATYEEFVKVETEKQKYLDEQAYKADEDARSKRIKELDEETKDILAEAKKRQDALADIAAQNEKAVKKNTDDYADDLKKNGFDDTKAKQDLADLETAYKNFEKVAMESAAKLVAEGEKGQAAAQEILEKYYPEYQNKGKKFVDYLVEGQKANQDKATAKARDIGAATVVGYVGGIDEQLPIVEAAGSSVDGAVADGMIAGINDVLKTVPKIVSSVVGKFDSYYTTIRSIGENIMRGIGAGLTSMSSWLTGLLDGYISDMFAATEARLGIASPSKVFADIGGFTAEGFGKGFVEAMANVRADMLAAIPTRIDAPTVGYDYGSTSTAAPTSIGGGLYQTNNFVFNVPTVTPSEIAKANRRASEALYRAR